MKYSKDPLVDRSLRHSIKDGMAHAAMAGSAETYLSAFALFFKATASQIALLSTLPPLLGALAQFLSAWIARRSERRKPAILFGAALQGAVWLPILGLPLLFPDYAVPLLVACWVLYCFCGQLTAPLWTSLMGDLVPEAKRGRFFGCRTRLTTISSFSALAAGGLTLHLFDAAGHTAWGFGVLFTFAFGARMLSVYQLARMHEPRREGGGGELRLCPAWLRAVRESGALPFTRFFVLMQTAVAIGSPFFSVYMLRDLQFSYLEYMASTGAAVLVQFLTLNTWGRIGDVFGHRLILVVTAMMVPVFPMLWLLADNFWYLLVLQCLSGLSWGGFSLSAGNLLYERVPSAQRVTYTAFHNILAAAGVFLGAMLGAALVSLLPKVSPLIGGEGVASSLLWLFVLSSAARMAVSVLFLRRVKELKKPRRSLTPMAFVFRVTRFNAFVGLAYEVVDSFRPGEPPATDPAAGVGERAE